MDENVVAKTIVKVLEAEGVEYVFGLPGSQILSVYDALYDSTIKTVLVRHEQCAGYMADAYSKMTGKPGVCVVTTGPGTTNIITGVYLSYTDSIPMVVLTGQNSTETDGKGEMQECDHVSLLRPVTKWSTTLIEPNRTREVLQRAFRIATSGRPGPVHIDIPENILNKYIESHTTNIEPARKKAEGVLWGDPREIDKAVELLSKAKRPMLLAGGGTIYTLCSATNEVLEISKILEMGIATTLNGFGVGPTNHPLSIGRVGIHTQPYTNKLLGKADVLLVVGCRLSMTGTNCYTNINKDTKIIHVDIDPVQIGKNYSVEVGILGDARTVLEQIISQLRKKGVTKDTGLTAEIAQEKTMWFEGWRGKAYSTDNPIKPQRLAREIREFFPKDTIFTVDAGNIHFWPAYEDILEPKTWINSGSASPMGYALPAAISCKLVKPDKPVVAIIGDGGFAMTCQEMATAAQYGLPITTIIINNGSLGYIAHLQEVCYGGRMNATLFKNPDFALMAKACGCYGERVADQGILNAALKRAYEATKSGSSAVLDVAIDPRERILDFIETSN